MHLPMAEQSVLPSTKVELRQKAQGEANGTRSELARVLAPHSKLEMLAQPMALLREELMNLVLLLVRRGARAWPKVQRLWLELHANLGVAQVILAQESRAYLQQMQRR